MVHYSLVSIYRASAIVKQWIVGSVTTLTGVSFSRFGANRLATGICRGVIIILQLAAKGTMQEVEEKVTRKEKCP